jgi:DNA-binding ferritin-like protein (Dps family)
MFEKLIEGIGHYRNSRFDRDAYLARVGALPKDYQIVYNGIADYMWSSGAGGGSADAGSGSGADTDDAAAGAGVTMMDTLLEILAAFEDGARDNKNVFSITGENVIEFADSLLRELPGETWMDRMKAAGNKNIVDKAKRKGGE